MSCSRSTSRGRRRWRGRSIISRPTRSLVSPTWIGAVLGTGLRWASLGQVLLNRLGGEQGGIEHFFDQFTGPMTAWWWVLGSPELNAEVRRKLTVRSSFSDCTGAFTTIRSARKHFWSGPDTRVALWPALYVPHNRSDTWPHQPALRSNLKTLANGGPSTRVDIARSPSRPRMKAIGAQQTAAIDG
jgi:hypothetical protein